MVRCQRMKFHAYEKIKRAGLLFEVRPVWTVRQISEGETVGEHHGQHPLEGLLAVDGVGDGGGHDQGLPGP